MYIVTNKKEILRVIKKFRRNVVEVGTIYPSVKLGWPSGSTEVELLALQNLNIWSLIATSHDDEKIFTGFGIGAVSENSMNGMTVQITMSLKGHFRSQGNILKDGSEYYIAHTGFTNKGFGDKVQLANSSFDKTEYFTPGGRARELFCIAKLLDKSGATHISELANIARYVREIGRLKGKIDTESIENVSILQDEEGGKTLSDGWVYKRSPKLVKERKRRDKYTCVICNFHYDDKIVHVHHLNPIGNRKEASLTDIKELVTLCPNCHALAHQCMREGLVGWKEIENEIRMFYSV
ncbi:hypothetical protein [Desulfovibrio sp. JC010]|uniref:HNH endonuclease n=1 Tax=Desulfovibrio sp. JC010 TaxID=2593641 RepID=UPI0013D60F40|nr:hypothetical protein [Desulfovibrio sp. JC010]NDV28174.1 hypothetical protein [Desulfovibrio sp. JC010]